MSHLHCLPPVGLINSNGRICFFNSLLQLLFSCDIFEHLMFEYENICNCDDTNIDKIISNSDFNGVNNIKKYGYNFTNKKQLVAFRKEILIMLITYMEKNEKSFINNKVPDVTSLGYDILQKIEANNFLIENNMQQDTCEFYLKLILITGISHVFNNFFHEKNVCDVTNKTSYLYKDKTDTTGTISYDDESLINQRTYLILHLDKTYENKTLSDLEFVELLFKPKGDSVIDISADIYLCDTSLITIGQTHTHTQYYLYDIISENLIVYINRDVSNGREIKYRITFPNKFKLKHKLGYVFTYELTADVNRPGDSVTGSHYHTFVKRCGIVFNCNDSHVSQLNETDIKTTRDSTLLLYKRTFCEVLEQQTITDYEDIRNNGFFEYKSL